MGLDSKPAPQRAAKADANVVAGLRFFGFSEESIAAQVNAQPAAPAAVDEDFEVYQDCWESVLFFLKVRRLWVCLPRMVPLGMAVGYVQDPHHLDRCEVEAEMNMQGIARKARAALLADLRVMEEAALAAMLEQRAAQ